MEALRQHISVDSLDTGLPHNLVFAICRGVELLAYATKASRHPSAAPAETPAADPILQAIDDHRAAFDAANSTDELTDEAAEEAFWRWQRIYKDLQRLTPTIPEGICALAAHLRQFLKDGQNEIGNTFVDEAFTTLLNAIDRYSAVDASRSATLLDTHDFGSIDSEALAHLCDVFEAIGSQWDAVSCQPVIEGARDGYGSAASLAHAESKRAERVRFRVVDEIRRRQPRDDGERDTLLSVRIRDELLREGSITDRDLLLEAVKAWG